MSKSTHVTDLEPLQLSVEEESEEQGQKPPRDFILKRVLLRYLHSVPGKFYHLLHQRRKITMAQDTGDTVECFGYLPQDAPYTIPLLNVTATMFFSQLFYFFC
jgi:hypothetical protein